MQCSQEKHQKATHLDDFNAKIVYFCIFFTCSFILLGIFPCKRLRFSFAFFHWKSVICSNNCHIFAKQYAKNRVNRVKTRDVGVFSRVWRPSVSHPCEAVLRFDANERLIWRKLGPHLTQTRASFDANVQPGSGQVMPVKHLESIKRLSVKLL